MIATKSMVTLLLGILGLQLFMLWSGGAVPLNPKVQLALLLAPIAAIAGIVSVRFYVNLALPRERWLAESVGGAVKLVLLFATATSYLYATAVWQHRAFLPSYHDEFSYLLQARMLTTGRLWFPSPPAAAFFESFQVVTAPVYASIYFPGAAILYAVGLLAHIKPWITAICASGLCVVLMFHVARSLYGSAAGWVAAVMLLGLTIFRLQSVMVMAQVPLLLMGLAMSAVWLRWRAAPSVGMAVALGGLVGWALITRPVDALCFGIPIGLAMLGRFISNLHLPSFPNPPSRASHAAFYTSGLAIIPFLMLQVCFNFSVTGSWVRAPFTQYASESYPQTEYGFREIDESASPKSVLPQKHAYYDQVARPLLRQHTPLRAARAWFQSRFRTTLLNGVPHPLMFVLLPIGFLALRRAEVLVTVAPLLLFPLLYWPYAFFLTHYTLTAAPAIIILVLGGIDALAAAAGRLATFVRVTFLIAVSAVTVVELPEFNRANFDEFYSTAQLRLIEQKLESIPANQSAIVLFRWAPACNPQEEPVYNVDDATIEAHRVIRAHDLGSRNQELFQAFARIQPGRMVYRYDRGDDSLVELGNVRQLATRSP